ncbi:hypothetical protein QBC34DRAFT_454911 [Podospora aff. communis PSN243]|uniref:Monooxygenase n=1 Tax=Podospora aff. communis PSN243 TaxID=3040156 RepID=A0AAV9G5M1_9PEZI|nr:hypothetical protein QBC34DRAFT_454911 [Podospora aff. communis PSN243]
MRVAVIGAGPSGLVTLKYLLTAHEFFDIDPFEVILLEAEGSVGGTFTYRTYEDAEMVSSKQLTTFSDFRPTSEDPDFLSAARYIRYLNEYCTHFGLWPHIKLSSRVTSLARNPKGGHIVSYTSAESGKTAEWKCDAVAICSGLHVTPSIPKLDGIENVPVSFHSVDFKTRSQFGTDKTVLVLGTGETGMDIAHMAVTSPTKRVVLSHRDGFLCAPKRIPDPVIFPILGNKPDPTKLRVPVDVSTASLFESAYVHPRLHPLLWANYDWFCKSTLWLVSGSRHGLGQFVGGISDARYHVKKIFFMKSNKAMPYISEPYRAATQSSLLQRIRSSLLQIPILPTHGRHIDLAPWPSHIDRTGTVHFQPTNRPESHRLRNETIKPDILIFATGYTQTFPFLNQTPHKTECYPTPSSPSMIRSVFSASDPSAGYIGFVRPSFGAIPPLSEFQAQLWIYTLLHPEIIPTLDLEVEEFYKLDPPPGWRIQYGVDHERYAYQLACDMGAAPSFTQVLKVAWRSKEEDGWWRLPLVWALGANFNVKFRLVGPWRWQGATGVLVGELWDTIARRGGFFGHVALSGLPMVVFGTLGLVLWLLEPILGVVLPVRDHRFLKAGWRETASSSSPLLITWTTVLLSGFRNPVNNSGETGWSSSSQYPCLTSNLSAPGRMNRL